MERITISLDEALAKRFDDFISKRGYANRSEALRDIMRREIESDRLARDEAEYCVAGLSYVFNHHERRLAERMTDLQHHDHDLVISSMHVHLDHDDCLETTILQGKTARVHEFAEKLMAECGVRHAQLNLIPVDIDGDHGHVHHHHKPTT